MNYLVLIRHGQSEWNAKNLFTGFKDVNLTEKGIEEAKDGGQKVKALGIKFDHVFTSTLKRAIETTNIVLKESGQSDLIPYITQHADLRERDYGDLTGLNKEETREKYGDEQFKIWRRGYDTPPPGGECLKDVVEKRVRPYYQDNIRPLLEKHKNVLVGAHGNSLRAMLIVLGVKTPENINEAEIPTGVPVIFEMDGADVIDWYFKD